MKKIVPITLLLISIAGSLLSAVGFLFALLAFVNTKTMVISVPILVLSCIFNSPPIVGGVIFIDRTCKVAMVISIIAYVLTLASFLLLFTV